MESQTGQTIDRIGRPDHDTALLDHLSSKCDQGRLGCLHIYLEVSLLLSQGNFRVSIMGEFIMTDRAVELNT